MITVKREALDLSWGWLEAQKAYRDMQREANKQKFLQSPLGQITAIDDHFCKVEEAFIAERAKEHETDILTVQTYDNVLLNIVRWHEVTILLLSTDNENVKAYIKKRATQPLELPTLPPRELTPLEQLVEKYLKENYLKKVAS